MNVQQQQPMTGPGASPAVTISALHGHADRAATLIAAVIADSDIGTWLVDGGDGYRILRGRCVMFIQQAFDHGHVDLSIGEDGQWHAVGVWLDRTRPVPAPPAYEDRLHRLAGGRIAARLLDFDAALAEHAPERGHHALVAAGSWGDGSGIAAVLAAGLERADRARVPAYAVAPTESSRELYERHGFVVAGVFDLPDGPRLWPMLRPIPRRARRT